MCMVSKERLGQGDGETQFEPPWDKRFFLNRWRWLVTLTTQHLLDSCAESGTDAGISMFASLEPLAGPHAPVKPAIYAGRKYQIEKRWWHGSSDGGAVATVVIDNVPSQANRIEAALETIAPELGLPTVVLDFSGVDGLPPHLPRQLSGFRFPHRQADAYLRDATLDGLAFAKTETGSSLLEATADRADALLGLFPQALLFGFWQSHLGKKRSQAKLARSWVSEIVGYDPADTDTVQLGLKGDPLNLSIDESVSWDPDDVLGVGWEVGDAKKAGGRKNKDSLAELGHGQVPVSESEAARTAVSFRGIEQQSTVSFAGLRRIRTSTPTADAAARAILVSLGLVGHVAAFGRAFSLRSGCDLRPRSTTWVYRGALADEEIEPLDLEAATALFRGCVAVGEEAGLPVGARWPSEPLVLAPNASLQKAIALSYPLSD